MSLIAEFIADPLSGSAPLQVQFTDLSQDSNIGSGGQPTITSWAWNFGDGETSTDEDPSHTYASPGKYTVSLEVVDNYSASATETKIDYIDTDPPTSHDISIEFENVMVYCKNADVDFSSRDSGLILSGKGMTVKTPGTFRAYSVAPENLLLSDSVISAQSITDEEGV